MHDGRFMRYNKAHPRTLAMLTDEAVPVRADGAIDLCQTCQRRTWYAGGYVALLTSRLAHLAEIVSKRQRFLRRFRRLQEGQSCGDVFRSGREEAVAAAKAVADELCWTILIQRRGWECLTIIRQPRAMGCHSAKTPQAAEAEGWQPGDARSAAGAQPFQQSSKNSMRKP